MSRIVWHSILILLGRSLDERIITIDNLNLHKCIYTYSMVNTETKI